MSESNDSNCGCTGDTVRAERDPAYRRALWIVVILNLGFGVCEIIGGFIANSQALKADSLDFIGDGSITLVGLLALGWSAASRSEEHTSELQSLMRISYAVFCLQKKNKHTSTSYVAIQ